MLSPDGTPGDVPTERVHEAVAKGFKVGVNMLPPGGGNPGVVPAEHYEEALQKGFTIPEQQHLAQLQGHPGGWGGLSPANLWENLKQGTKELGQGLYGLATSTPESFQTGIQSGLQREQGREQALLGTAEQAEKQGKGYQLGTRIEAAGHGLASVLPGIGPWAAGIGEQAGTGDVGGAIARAAPQIAAGEAPRIAKLGGSAVEAGTQATGDVLRKVTPTQVAQGVGGVGGAIAGRAGGPFGEYLGIRYLPKIAGRATEAILGAERANQPILRGSVRGGPGLGEVPTYQAPPEVEGFGQPKTVEGGPPAGEVSRFGPPANLGPVRTLPGAISPERLYGPYKTGAGSVIPRPEATVPPTQRLLPAPYQPTMDDLIREIRQQRGIEQPPAIARQPDVATTPEPPKMTEEQERDAFENAYQEFRTQGMGYNQALQAALEKVRGPQPPTEITPKAQTPTKVKHTVEYTVPPAEEGVSPEQLASMSPEELQALREGRATQAERATSRQAVKGARGKTFPGGAPPAGTMSLDEFMRKLREP